jgi:hypothetical protein
VQRWLRFAPTVQVRGGRADADADADAGTVELVVTNSLTPELRFAAETVRYELSAGVG